MTRHIASAFALCLALLLPAEHALAANILFVSDSGDDLGIATALTADGHTVTTSPTRFAAGSNAALRADLSAYDAVYWSQDGTGSGDAVTDAMLFANLNAYVMGGGRVFVTGYDSVANPTDPLLIAFLGATNSTDTFSDPGPIAMLTNSLTTGVVDIRGVAPTDGAFDLDALTGLTSAVAVTGTSSSAQWTLRTLGAGEIAYVSNGNNTGWTTTTAGGAGAYNAALRNFAFAAVVTGTCAGVDGSACTVTGIGAGAGRCYGGVCCPGCWDAGAMRCRSGRAANTCGVAGALCIVCDDEDQCTTDTCSATGTCTYPLSPSGRACDDGAYCTATDTCDGAGACLGTGSPCDDSSSCTTDICDEGAMSCVNEMLPDTCLIAGTCVASGTANPTNACQNCDSATSTTAWSPIPVGSACGNQICSAGRFFPAGACNSSGLCEPPAARDCPTNMCDGTICEGACTAASCATGTFCSNTTLECEPLIADGGGCSLSSSCASGFCTDGVCCESACTGTCSRCGGTGRCALIASGADPDRECAGDDVCNGAGMCRMATVADAGVDTGVVMMDAGTDVGMEMLDTGPEDAGSDGGSFDANIMLPDVPFNVDAGGETGREGCSCSAPGTPARHAPLGMVVGLAIALGLLRRRR